MACEEVRFMMEDNYPKFGAIGLATGGPAMILGWVLWGLGAAITLTLAVLFFANIAWRIIVGKRVVATAKASWHERGYSIDFEVGMLLIDAKKKKIGFLEPANATYDIYDFSDIRGWEHQWVDKTSTQATAVHGLATANTRTSQVENRLVFKTDNPAKPLYKIQVPGHKAGEMWMARLGALFNS